MNGANDEGAHPPLLETGVDSDFRPGEWALRSDLDEAAPERKSPPLSVLYPEKDDYLLLSPDRYTDPDFMRREWEAVWSRSWTCAGLASDLKEPGDWIRYDLGPESFVVVRGRDHVLRAFHNVCRHRGRRIVEDETGHAASFVCPFHHWIYGLDGANLRVSDRELFAKKTLGGDLGLAPVRCEAWGAFVFVCMDPEAPPLEDCLGSLADLLEAYHMEAMHPVKDVTVDVACNWKVACEAFLEPYHTHATHPQILGSIDELYNQYDFYPDGHSRVITPLGRPSPRLTPTTRLNADLAASLAAAGIEPDTFPGGPSDVRSALQAVKRRTDNPFGLDYADLSDDQLVDNWNPSFFPNLVMNLLPESAQIMRFLPHPTDPGRCWFHVWTLMPKTRPGTRPTAFFGVDDDADLTGQTRPSRRHTDQRAPELGDVLEQDVANMPLVQQGLGASGCGPLRLSEQEQRIQQLHAELDRRIDALRR